MGLQDKAQQSIRSPQSTVFSPRSSMANGPWSVVSGHWAVVRHPSPYQLSSHASAWRGGKVVARSKVGDNFSQPVSVASAVLR